MKLDSKYILYGILIVMAAFFYNKFNPNDEDIIRGRLHEMAEFLYMDAPEKKLEAFQKATGIKEYFTELIDLKIKMKYMRRPNITDRVELMRQYGIFRSILNRFDIEFTEIAVEFDGKDIAHVSTTVMLDFHINNVSGDQGDYIPMKIEFRKDEGEWRIRHIETLKEYDNK